MDRLIVTRHTTLERLSHYTNIASLALLLASGFSMYLGLPYLSYGDAYSIHIIAAPRSSPTTDRDAYTGLRRNMESRFRGLRTFSWSRGTVLAAVGHY